MISFHPNRADIGKHWIYAKGYYYVDTDDPQKIAKLINNYVTSPIVWKEGVATKKTFLCANWIGLDIDDGYSLAEIVEAFQDHTHVIGTTKNHQKIKGNDLYPRDRMRVYLQLKEKIEHWKEFESCMEFYSSMYGSDIAARDGARRFMPCREIVSVVKKEPIPIRKRIRIRRQYDAPRDGNQKSIPTWIAQLLAHGVEMGQSRNTACYKVGIYLTRAGYSVPEIVAKIMNSPIPVGSHVVDEVERAVKSGAKKA